MRGGGEIELVASGGQVEWVRQFRTCLITIQSRPSVQVVEMRIVTLFCGHATALWENWRTGTSFCLHSALSKYSARDIIPNLAPLVVLTVLEPRANRNGLSSYRQKVPKALCKNWLDRLQHERSNCSQRPRHHWCRLLVHSGTGFLQSQHTSAR